MIRAITFSNTANWSLRCLIPLKRNIYLIEPFEVQDNFHLVIKHMTSTIIKRNTPLKLLMITIIQLDIQLKNHKGIDIQLAGGHLNKLQIHVPV